jgi:hypothetical protein
MQTLQKVRRELAELYLALKNDTVDPVKGRVMVYCLCSLADIIKGAELEAQVMRLKRRFNGTEEIAEQ